jgi:hypothetical protein
MMGTGHELGEPVVDESSGLRRIRRWRLLLAHDATASTCEPLIDAIEGALGNVDVNESSSVDDAQVALHSGPIDLAMVCLDLPPAPLGGVRLAQEFLREGLPVILVTRSLRWIPRSAVALHDLPWVTPDATAAEVERAVIEVMASFNAPLQSGPRGSWMPRVRGRGSAPALPGYHAGGE